MQKIITKKFIQYLVLATVLSVAANLILLIIVRPIAMAPATFSPFQYSPVIEFTILGVMAAAVVYLFVKKFFHPHYKKIFIWVSIVALVLSCIPDILMPYSTDADNQGATWFIVLILILMHILTAGIVLGIFTKKLE